MHLGLSIALTSVRIANYIPVITEGGLYTFQNGDSYFFQNGVQYEFN